MTELEICNWALLKLGQRPLENGNERSLKADYCRLLLPPIHKGLLRSFSWSFATQSMDLSPLDFTYNGELTYRIPLKCLKVLNTSEKTQLRGRYIVACGETPRPLSLKYIGEVPLSDCGPLYQEAFALKLAGELCPHLISDDQLRSYLKGESERVLAVAMDMDGVEIPEDRDYHNG